MKADSADTGLEATTEHASMSSDPTQASINRRERHDSVQPC